MGYIPPKPPVLKKVTKCKDKSHFEFQNERLNPLNILRVGNPKNG